MGYYDEDFFYEPTEFEGQLEEFKQALTESIRDDYKEKMAQLEQENVELRKVKNDFETIKQSYQDAEREFRFRRSELERSVKKERLTELMKDFEITLYHAELKFETGPKCDRCDKHRMIKYVTPLGREAEERCDCADTKPVYRPEEMIVVEFGTSRNERNLVAWYKKSRFEDSDHYHYEDSTYLKTIYVDGMEYEDLDVRETFFRSPEECQAYCDWLNAKQTEQKRR